MEDDITIRRMQRGDIERVAEIERVCFRSPWSVHALIGELSNDIAYYVVAVQNGYVVGYAGIWVILDEAHMNNIAVSPEYRERGIGKSMILRLMGIALNKGAERMTLEVRENNHRAQRLYASLGFAYAGMRKGYYSDNGENALILWNDCIIETYEKNTAPKNAVDNKED